MKKTLISLFLTLILVSSLCVPALATDVQTPLRSTASYYGYTFTESFDSDGNCTIFSYYNGQLQKKYTIEQGKDFIRVDKMDSGIWKITYTLESANKRSSIVPMADRWASAGNIYYNESDTVGTVNAIMMAYGSNRTVEIPLDVEEDTPFDDVAVFIANVLIYEGLSKWAAVAGITVMSLSASILTAAIACIGATVIVGVITTAFTETIPASETVWKFRATPQIGSTFGTSEILENQGSSFIVYMPDSSEWQSWEEGYTLYDWAYPLFAQRVWSALFPQDTYPGVSRFASVF